MCLKKKKADVSLCCLVSFNMFPYEHQIMATLDELQYSKQGHEN